MSTLALLGNDTRALGLCGYLNGNNHISYILTTEAIPYTDSCNVRLNDSDGDYMAYPIMCIADNVDFNQISKLINPEIKTFVLNADAHKKFLNEKRDLMIVSCCGKELNTKYTSFLNNSNCKGSIIVLDADKSIAVKANNELINFTVKSAVVDMYCPGEPKYDSKTRELRAHITRSSTIVFPPKCRIYRRYFGNSFSSSLHSIYTNSYEEFERAVNEKLVNIAIPYTIMALFAWQYFNYNRKRDCHFSQIPYRDFQVMKDKCLFYHEQLCATWLFKRSKHYRRNISKYGLAKELLKYSRIAENRIDLLYITDDMVVRIINPASEASLRKLKKHMRIVSVSSPNDHLLRDIVLHLIQKD